MSHPDPQWVIPAPPRPALAVVGGGHFPVRRVYCIARNYAAHAREMGGDPQREAPFFFLKPADAVMQIAEGERGSLPYPPATRDLHHEVELVVALRAGGRNLSVEAAAAAIYGYAIGLDMTRRDLQADAKAQGRPWEIGKSFDAAAPISALWPRGGEVLQSGEIALEVNGQLRQHGDLSDMIWSIPEQIAFFSRYSRLEAGDLIFTGTPSGVAAVQPGDHLRARIAGLGSLELEVTPPALD